MATRKSETPRQLALKGILAPIMYMAPNAPQMRLIASRFHKRFYRRMSIVTCYRGLMTLPPAILAHATTVLSTFADALFVNTRTRFRFTLDAFLAEAYERGLALEPVHLLLMQNKYKILKRTSPVYQVYIMHLEGQMPTIMHFVRGHIYHWLFLGLRFTENPTVDAFRVAVKEDPHVLNHLRWMSQVHRLARACLTQRRCDLLFSNIPLNEEELLHYWLEKKTEAPDYESDAPESDYDSESGDAMDADADVDMED